MRITWNIEKKRGNYRPLLKYKIILEDYERELAVYAVSIETKLPRLDNSHQDFCMPGTNERAPGWEPRDFHWISVPYFKDGESSGSMRLPFKKSGEYHEVEQSFRMLRDSYEKIVKESYGWKPIQQSGELDISDETRQSIAATLAAKKMLEFYL